MPWRTTEDWLTIVNPNLPADPPKDVAELFKTVTEALSTIPNGPEKSAGMRKLLEAKDCFVRSVIR